MKAPRLALICLLGLAPACVGPQERFAPAPGALTATDLDAAVIDSDGGVRAIAQVEAWDGEVVLRNNLTTIKLILQNTSRQPALVRLSDVVIVTEGGERHVALKPREITGQALLVMATPIYSPDGRSVGISRYDYA